MSRGHRRGGEERGHWCWCCERVMANERFSGRGHGRHLCRQCARLPGEQREYMQALHDMQRCLTYDGHVRRKQRRACERFLNHPDARIRHEAQECVLTSLFWGAVHAYDEELLRHLFQIGAWCPPELWEEELGPDDDVVTFP